MIKPEYSTIKLIHAKIKTLAPDIICHKISERFTNGWPDCKYIGLQGQHLYVEYKIEKNPLSPLQKLMIQKLREHNVPVWIITKTKHGDYSIQTALETRITHEPWTDIIDFLK
jgi:ribosomal protein L39E